MVLLYRLVACLILSHALVLHAESTEISKDITLVYITDDTIEQIGSFPFSRAEYGKFIDAIYENYDPKVVYIDLFLVDENKQSPDSDSALAQSLHGKQGIIFGAMIGKREIDHSVYANSQWENVGSGNTYPMEGALLPIPELMRQGAHASFSTVNLNEEGHFDRFPTLFVNEGTFYPSTPLAAASLYLGDKDRLLESLERDSNGGFRVVLEHRFPKFTFHQVLEGEVPAEYINGRIVMLGAIFSGAGDLLPVGQTSLMQGTEYVANATQTILDSTKQD